MIPRQLQLPGKTLPPALPLILPFSKSNGSGARLVVNEEAMQILKTVKKPVAVLSVCGPYRTGKSYLLSRLLGSPGTFQLGHSMDACTRGIWLSTTALECDDHLLLLLDTEGIGCVEGEPGSSEYLLSLLVITTLLSSTLLYNCSEVPQASDLEQMSMFAHLTRCVAVRRTETGTSTAEELQSHFPKFIWLLRNVICPPLDEEGQEIPLKTYIHSEVASSTQQSQLVIETLESAFPSLECLYLPPPSADPTHTSDLDTHWEQLEEDFREKMEEIQQYLFHHVTTKLSFDRTTPITGADLAVLLREYVTALNTPGSLPSLQESWVAVIKLKFEGIFAEVVSKYTRDMEEKTNGLFPMEENLPPTFDDDDDNDDEYSSLMQLHWCVFDECYSTLRQSITKLLPHHMGKDLSMYTQSLLMKFSSTVAEFDTQDLLGTEGLRGGLLLRFVQQNYKVSEEMCEKLWERLFEESGIQNKAVRALNRSKAIDVGCHMAELIVEYMENAVGPAKIKVLERKQAANDVEGMLRDLPGPPVSARLVGREKDKQKLTWDRPAINPRAALRYVVQKRTKEGWKDVATTDKCWVVLDKQSKRDCVYRVTSLNEGEHNKGEMEQPLVVANNSVSCAEWLSYV